MTSDDEEEKEKKDKDEYTNEKFDTLVKKIALNPHYQQAVREFEEDKERQEKRIVADYWDGAICAYNTVLHIIETMDKE